MIGIYKITSPTGKVYVGQSIDIEKRFKFHKEKCHKGKLKDSFSEHGVDNHIFEVLKECEIEKLNELERYYQLFYDCIGENGLNSRITIASNKVIKNCKLDSNQVKLFHIKFKDTGCNFYYGDLTILCNTWKK